MELQKRMEGDIMISGLSGEISISTSPELRKLCSELIDKQIKKLILDFGSVAYIDSSGMATLVEMFRKMKQYGGKLRLCNLSDKVRSIFEITKLTKRFERFDSEEKAKSGF